MSHYKSIEKKLGQNDFIVSKTDTNGKIIYGNETFIKISGYDERELLGAPHSILRHPDMPKTIFSLLWDRVKAKKEVFAYVKNLCKDGSYYWVFANVTATLDKHGQVRDFHSVRRRPSARAIEVVSNLYKTLSDIERNDGVVAAKNKFACILRDKGMTYDEFVLSLQK